MATEARHSGTLRIDYEADRALERESLQTLSVFGGGHGQHGRHSL